MHWKNYCWLSFSIKSSSRLTFYIFMLGQELNVSSYMVYRTWNLNSNKWIESIEKNLISEWKMKGLTYGKILRSWFAQVVFPSYTKNWKIKFRRRFYLVINYRNCKATKVATKFPCKTFLNKVKIEILEDVLSVVDR